MKLVIVFPQPTFGDKLFDNSSSVLLASSSSTTEDDQEEDVTYFEIGSYPVIDTANRDQATIEPSDKILPDSALDNTVSNHICEKCVEVGSSSFNPTINDNINESSSSKDNITSNSCCTSEANAIFLVLGGSPEFINYDIEKDLFKLGKASLETIESLKDTQSKFQQQVLKKVSTLQVQFENWEIFLFRK